MKGKKVLGVLTGLVFMICFVGFSTLLAYAQADELSVEEQNRAAQEEAALFESGVPALPSLYAKDVKRLNNLHLLPTGAIAWSSEANWADFMTILSNLNAKKPGIVPGLAQWNLTVNTSLTYAQAIEVLLPILGYTLASDQENIDLAKRLGINVEKENIYDKLTGEEMAHLVYQTLTQKPLKAKKEKTDTSYGSQATLLAEVYLPASIQMPTRKIVKVTASTIEVEYDGTFTMASGVTVFDANTNEPLSMSDVVVGMTGAYLILDDNRVVTSIGIQQQFVPNMVRVLISSALSSTGGSTSYDFTDAKISANRSVYVRTKDTAGLHTLATIASGTTFTLTNSGGTVYYNGTPAGSRVYIESDYSDVQLTLQSTTRGGAYPVYDGTFEVIPSTTAGKLYVINELSMEKYLYKVVPSEMPASWHVEALKCQAVAARSYAVGQIYGGGYKSKSANVDDSTNCQVYNNSATTTGVINAVNATGGQVMTYNGEVITAYFFSTSSGCTANNENVWHNSSTGAFPGVPIAYVRALPQILNYTYPSFSNEAAMLTYFKTTSFSNAFDRSAAWFRWNVNLTRAELEATISKNLPLRESADQTLGTNFIQTISGTAPVPGSTTFSIGTLKDIRVIQRGEGGNAMTLEIVGTNGTWRVLKEYNIRMVIKPTKVDTKSTRDIIINCHTGAKYTNYSLLPSSFASFEIHKDRKGLTITDVTIYGGGNGHGVGMSQYGAKGYAEAGYLYQDILRKFYTSIAFTTLY